MATKRKNLFLYLALVCFLGIILIFIFDGYIGLYDSLLMDNGQYPQHVEADQWRQDRLGYSMSTNVERGSKVKFVYEVDNRRFSTYTADVAVSAWHGEEKLADLLAQPITVASFAKGEVEWSLDTAALIPADFPPEQSYNVNVVIQRGELERQVIININPNPYPPNPIIIKPSR